MKTQYYAAASLDGFIATDDDSLDWLFQFGSVEATSYPAFIREVGALAMGSATYEWLRRHLQTAAAGATQPWPYAQPTWVFSSQPREAIPGADVRFVRGDVRSVHGEMGAAAQGKNVWIVGGGELAAQFLDHGLLDELIIQMAPVFLHRGKALLPRRLVTPPLQLLAIDRFPSGLVELRYAPKPAAATD